MTHRFTTLAALLAAVILAGCSSTDAVAGGNTADAGAEGGAATPQSDAGGGGDGGGDGAPAAANGELKVQLVVPTSFTAEPVKIVLLATSKLPMTGPPDGGILLTETTTSVNPGSTRTLKADASSLVGRYYILAVLYVKGGGNLAPKADVDYDAASATAFTFDGRTPIDAGVLTFAVHRSGDGH